MLKLPARTVVAAHRAGCAFAAGRRFSTTPHRAAAAEIKHLGVVGAGQMGLGIALVAAQKAAVPVTLVDQSQAALDKGLAFADKLLAKDVGKGRLSQADADAARARLVPATSLDALGAVDFVIEAVPEIPDLKCDLFRRLAAVAPAHAVLATNTSSISITKIAAAAGVGGGGSGGAGDAVAARVVATHFMNPVPVQRGVEIIRGLQTSDATLATAVAFCRAMGKIPSTSADTPGFLANRILMPYLNEAIICLETGVGDRDSIDAIMKNGTNVPMGPLQLADFIGLDTCLAILQVLHRETGDSKYRPSVLLAKMVDAGWLGKKTGKGFYDY
ncbi:3-hydroxybutyryl-dehydrogenase [Niveomyces insectorum RCEF 264]|uniref:3-hydroxybutyryl-dehydrogenase n=1 Tax=Niveomyces insectorum RCEF 264 TaxID=1081102 RepID=A0A168AHU5_9HYPO|nr:3-hydroxybutyryl-dehydrogenase [Niveomyces insectorum RCEF 264]